MIERFFSLKLHVYTLNAHLSTETENRQKFQKINYVIDMSFALRLWKPSIYVPLLVEAFVKVKDSDQEGFLILSESKTDRIRYLDDFDLSLKTNPILFL